MFKNGWPSKPSASVSMMREIRSGCVPKASSMRFTALMSIISLSPMLDPRPKYTSTLSMLIQLSVIILLIIQPKLHAGFLRQHGAVPFGLESELDSAFGDARDGFDALADLVGGFVEELREMARDGSHADTEADDDIGFLIEDAEDALDSILTARDHVLDAEGEPAWMADQEGGR